MTSADLEQTRTFKNQKPNISNVVKSYEGKSLRGRSVIHAHLRSDTLYRVVVITPSYEKLYFERYILEGVALLQSHLIEAYGKPLVSNPASGIKELSTGESLLLYLTIIGKVRISAGIYLKPDNEYKVAYEFDTLKDNDLIFLIYTVIWFYLYRLYRYWM